MSRLWAPSTSRRVDDDIKIHVLYADVEGDDLFGLGLSASSVDSFKFAETHPQNTIAVERVVKLAVSFLAA